MSKIVLPYEPEYVGGREAEKRREETKQWLRNRERELGRVLINPAHPMSGVGAKADIARTVLMSLNDP
jgi:hypothetical protein